MTDEIDSDANSTHELTAEVARALIARSLATDHGGVLHRRESGGSALCPGGYRGIFMIPA